MNIDYLQLTIQNVVDSRTWCCGDPVTFSPTPYKVTDHNLMVKVWIQPHAAKMKSKHVFTCIDVPAADEKQEDLKKESLPGVCHDDYPSVLCAGRLLPPPSSCCIAYTQHHTTHPILPQLHEWRSHATTQWPVGGSLHPLLKHISILGCSVLSCFAWAEHAAVNTPGLRRWMLLRVNTMCCCCVVFLQGDLWC